MYVFSNKGSQKLYNTTVETFDKWITNLKCKMSLLEKLKIFETWNTLKGKDMLIDWKL